MERYYKIHFHPENCLNSKGHYANGCRRCEENCPHGAIAEDKSINLDRCSQCGLCMALCPSDGFVHRDIVDIISYCQKSEQIVLACPSADIAAKTIPCIGMLDHDFWHALQLTGQKNQAIVVTGDCSHCLDRQAGLVGKVLYDEICQKTDGNSIIVYELPVSREAGGQIDQLPVRLTEYEKKRMLGDHGRDLMKKFFPVLTKTLSGPAAEKEHDIPYSRQWLQWMLEKGISETITLDGLKVEPTCSACGTCVKICPQKALSLIEEGEKQQLFYEPLKCVCCNRCLDTCVSKSLKREPQHYSRSILQEHVLLVTASASYCLKCGSQMLFKTEDDLCPHCSDSRHLQG